MDFNNGSVPPNRIPNFMSVPPYLVPQYNQADKEKQALQLFWQQQYFEITNAKGSRSFTNDTPIKSQHQLPLARIKRIMKADGDVKMITAETPIVFAKACEIFIQELTLRAWMRTEERNRRTVQRCDIAKAINKEKVFNFLADVVPMDHDDADEDSKEADSTKHVEETPVTQPAAFVNNPMMNMGIEANSGQLAEGIQVSQAGALMNNPMMNMGNEVDSGQLAEGTQVIQPAAFLDKPIMSMAIDLGAISHQFSQPHMMQPPFVPSSEFQYNFDPK